MEFRELSDEEWELIRPLLPPKAKTGRPRINDRLVINGILYVLVTGCRWMDIPIKLWLL
ncbi:MAG: transposase [Candidatus Methanomethylicia archaeon]